MNPAQTARSDLRPPRPTHRDPSNGIVTLLLHVQRRLQTFNSQVGGQGRWQVASIVRAFSNCALKLRQLSTIENQTMRSKVGNAKPAQWATEWRGYAREGSPPTIMALLRLLVLCGSKMAAPI